MRLIEKGLDQIEYEKYLEESQPKKQKVVKIPLDQIIPSPHIRRLQEDGLVQPLIVRKKSGDDDKYEPVCGNMRLEWCEIAGVEKIPVIIRNDIDDRKLWLLQFQKACVGCDNDWTASQFEKMPPRK